MASVISSTDGHSYGLLKRASASVDPDMRRVLLDAADFANAPQCTYTQCDVPQPAAVPTPNATVKIGMGDFHEAGELYVLELRDNDGNLHPAVKAAKGKASLVDRKTVVYYTPDGVVRAIEPKGIKEAMQSLQAAQWKIAIDKELDNLRSHHAFHYVTRKSVMERGKRVLRMVWVFKIKTQEDGSLNKFKARFCVVGSGMEKGVDFFEKYAGGARMSSVKQVLVLTAVQDWIDFHFDLDGAYLEADIDAEVYVEQGHGVDPEVGPHGEEMVMALDKAIYGTVQAGRLFTKKFRAALIDMGAECSLDDECVYRLDHRLGRIILSTHVDDGIGGASTQAVLDWFYDELIKRGFSFSQRGSWDTLVGFGCSRDRANRTVTLTATKQIRELAREHLASEVAANLNPPTPTAASIMKLVAAPEETPEEAALNADWRKQARSLKGALIHVSHVHPAISHGVSRACQFMATPTRESHAAAKRILAWLKQHENLGVTYGAPHIDSLDKLKPPDIPPMPMDSDL